MGLCSSTQAAKEPARQAAAQAKQAAGGGKAREEKVADGAAAHSFEREFHPDSTIWVFKERTPHVWDVYTKEGAIGERGFYGKAFRGRSTATGDQVVIKKISKRRHGYTKRMMTAYRREIATLRHVNHRNLIGLVDAFEDRDSLYIVMELASGGELYEHILTLQNYSERDAVGIFRQLLEGVSAMHAENLGHFDLKPSNCVFSSKAKDAPLKVIDFGMARFWEAAKRERFHTPAGTVQYSSPEVIRRDYNLAADMWSLGVMLYVMLIGFPPFYDNPSYHLNSVNGDQAAAERASNRNIKKKILGGFNNTVKKGYGPWFSSEKGVPQLSASAMDLIARLLETDVSKRLTVGEALVHPWVVGDAVSDEPIAPLVHDALRKFNAIEAFEKQVLNLMTDILPDVEIAQLEKTFAAMDVNGDNCVTIAEFRDAMKSSKLHANTVDEATIEKLFAMADLDNNGSLCYEELLTSLVHLKLTAKEERLWDAFQQLDRDGNGLVTTQELHHVLELEDPAEAEAMIRRVDSSKDGRVDYDEFLEVWRTEHTNKF